MIGGMMKKRTIKGGDEIMIYVTGDIHGQKSRFQYVDSVIEKNLKEGDKLFVCGDFGYIWDNSHAEKQFLRYLSKKPYQILFVDGNHENFDLINDYPVEEWCGGKVHVIGRDREGFLKIVHLMRGQIFEIEEKKIFTFGGAYSIDKYMRTPHKTWFPQEMPTDDEMKEAIANLKRYDNKVDYIITHAAPEDTMSIFHPYHPEEKPLNNFLEWIRENVEYKHFYMGHLHRDEDIWRHQTILWFQLRNMITNEIIE